MPTNTPARGARGQSWEGDCSNRQSDAPRGAFFMLGHALCRSNSSSEKSALAATPQIGGNPALDLWWCSAAWR